MYFKGKHLHIPIWCVLFLMCKWNTSTVIRRSKRVVLCLFFSFCTRLLYRFSFGFSCFFLVSVIVPHSFLFFSWSWHFWRIPVSFSGEYSTILDSNEVMHSGQELHLSQCLVLRALWCTRVLSLVILPTLNTWIRWYLLGFSIVKLVCFPW